MTPRVLGRIGIQAARLGRRMLGAAAVRCRMSCEKRQLRFSDVDIYYNYVFDLGGPVNPIDAARRMLGTELGQAFRNYVTGNSEVADRYRVRVQAFEKLRRLRNDIEKIETGQDLVGHLRILRSNPRLYGVPYFHALKETFWPSNSRQEGEAQEDGDIDRIISEMAEAIGDLLGLLAIQEHVDREIFFSGYMESVPFTRVALEPFAVVMDQQELDFDVTLTIHRSGVAMLTVYGVFSGSLSVHQVRRLQRASQLGVMEFDLPRCAIQRYLSLLAGHAASGRQIREFEASDPSTHRGHVRFEADEGSVLGEAFDAYRYFVVETIRGRTYGSIDDLERRLRSAEWHAYPMVFIKSTEPSYPSATALKEAHPEALARLVLGLDTSSTLKPGLIKETCEQDLSIVDDYSLYLTEGSGTAIYCEDYPRVPPSIAANEWIRQKFLTTVVVDMLLLQKGLLTALNAYLDKATYDVTRLNQLRKEYLLGLEEFEALRISYYGSVHDMIKHGQRVWRIDDLRSVFLTKLDGNEGLIQVAESKQRASLERRAKTLTTLGAAVLALPAARDVVDVLLQWPSNAPSWCPGIIRALYSAIIDHVSEYPTTATVILWVMIVCITLVALWSQFPLASRLRRQVLEDRATPTSRERTVSPVTFTVSPYVESAQAHDGPEPTSEN